MVHLGARLQDALGQTFINSGDGLVFLLGVVVEPIQLLVVLGLGHQPAILGVLQQRGRLAVLLGLQVDGTEVPDQRLVVRVRGQLLLGDIDRLLRLLHVGIAGDQDLRPGRLRLDALGFGLGDGVLDQRHRTRAVVLLVFDGTAQAAELGTVGAGFVD